MSLKYRFLLCFFILFRTTEVAANGLSGHDSYVNALASMVYHIGHYSDDESISFTQEQVQKLWDKIFELTPKKHAAFVAHQNYIQSKKSLESGDQEGAERAMSLSYHEMEELWEESIDVELTDIVYHQAERPVANYSGYPHLTTEMKKKFAPYLIPNDHPMRSRLHKLFSQKRVTAHHQAFGNAGFKIVSERPRSYVIVAKHKDLPGHLIKCYVDTETRQKWGKPSWYWLEQRCKGARKIRKILETKTIKYFDVAKKYLYVLPLLDQKKPYDECYTRHPAIVLVTDMQLVSEKDNLYAWKNVMNEERLDELYYIISRAKGASYRAQNIAYSHSGKFCFIDTEYPGKGPEYYRIAKELSPQMLDYWNTLIATGGNP